MTARFMAYQHALENALQAGNATEHTHHPALKELIESLNSSITADKAIPEWPIQ